MDGEGGSGGWVQSVAQLGVLAARLQNSNMYFSAILVLGLNHIILQMASRNQFALLPDDDTGDAGAKAVQIIETKPAAAAVKKTEAAAPVKATDSKAAATQTRPAGKTQPLPRKTEGGAPRRSDRSAATTEGAQRDDEFKSKEHRAPRHVSAERGGRGGARGGARGGRGREFDRRSGTGIRDSEKKETQGWGAAEKAYGMEKTDNVGGDADKSAPTTPASAEPEDKTKTLEEYRAELARQTAANKLPEERRPGEGADSKWRTL